MKQLPSVQYTGLSNENSSRNYSKLTKIVFFVCAAVALVAASVVVVYIITKYTTIGAGIFNNKSDSSRKSTEIPVTSPGSLYSSGSYILYTKILPIGQVGNAYKGAITMLFFGVHTKVAAKPLNGLPAGLQLSPCNIKYDNPDIKEANPITTYGRCDITGTPTKPGKYTLKVEIDRPSMDPIVGDFPLTVNP